MQDRGAETDRFFCHMFRRLGVFLCGAIAPNSQYRALLLTSEFALDALAGTRSASSVRAVGYVRPV
jgi:hypothetical protein